MDYEFSTDAFHDEILVSVGFLKYRINVSKYGSMKKTGRDGERTGIDRVSKSRKKTR